MIDRAIDIFGSCTIIGMNLTYDDSTYLAAIAGCCNVIDR